MRGNGSALCALGGLPEHSCQRTRAKYEAPGKQLNLQRRGSKQTLLQPPRFEQRLGLWCERVTPDEER